MKINLKLFICLLVGLLLISSLVVVFTRRNDISDSFETDVTTTAVDDVGDTGSDSSVTDTVQGDDSDPVVNPDFPDSLEGTFLFNQTIDCSYEAYQSALNDIDFTNNGVAYDRIFVSTCPDHESCYCMVYMLSSNDIGEGTIVYCDTSGWRSQSYRTIDILSGQEYSEKVYGFFSRVSSFCS